MSLDDTGVFTLSFPEYTRVAAARNMHNLPRFGHSAEFSNIWGTGEEQNDYIVGLLFAGVFVASFLFAWVVVLLVLMCIPGVGFLNGSRFKSSAGRRPQIIRGIFLFSAVLVITFAVCFVTQGLTQLDDTVSTMNLSARQVQSLSTRADVILEDMRIARNVTANTLPSLVNDLENFCPADPNLAEEIDVDIVSAVDAALEAIGSLGDAIRTELERLNVAVIDLTKSSTSIVDSTDDVEINSWQSLIVIIPYTVITFLLMVAAVLAWKGIELRPVLCLTYWLILPLFIFLIVFAFALSAAIAIGASANADFCSGGEETSPAGSILQMMENEGFSETDLFVQVVAFYISRCSSADAFAGFRTFRDDLTTTVDSVGDFNASLFEAGEDILANRCGAAFASSVLSSTAVVSDNLLRQLGNVFDLLALTACDEIVPLFINTFQTGTCDYSVQGATWMFAAFLIVGIFGMLMVTFRSALLPDEIDNEWTKDTPYYGEEDFDEDEVAETGVAAVDESVMDDDVYLSGSVIHSDLSDEGGAQDFPETSQFGEDTEKSWLS